MQYVSNGLRALGMAAVIGATALSLAAPAFGQQVTNLPEQGTYENKTDKFDTKINPIIASDSFIGNEALQRFKDMEKTISSENRIH